MKSLIVKEFDSRFSTFIKKHHVFTLATAFENKAYCANCFYAFAENEKMLVFTSDNDTTHIKHIKQSSYVAGSIVLETSIIGKIQGLQFNGFVQKPEGDELTTAKKRYLTRFPIAALMNTTLWTLHLTFAKLTDNRLGFGTKLIWHEEGVSISAPS